MTPQQGRKSASLLDPRQHPQRVTKIRPETPRRKRIQAVSLTTQQIQKTRHILLMQESAVALNPKELRKIETRLPVRKIKKKRAKIIRVYVHRRKIRIGVRIARMILIPVTLSLLLSYIVPRVYLVRRKILILQNIERSAAKLQYPVSTLSVPQLRYHALPKVSLSALVRLVHYNQVPTGVKYQVILIVRPPCRPAPAQILKRGEIYRVLALHLCPPQQALYILALRLRAITPLPSDVIEYLGKLVKPLLVHHRTMSKYQHTTHGKSANRLKGAQSLPKPHLRIP